MKKAVEAYNAKGILVGVYDSTKDAANAHGVGVANISNCVLGKQETSAGLTWKFADAEIQNDKPHKSKPIQKTNTRRVVSAIASNQIGNKVNQVNRLQAIALTDTTTQQRTDLGWRWMVSGKTHKQVAPQNIQSNLNNGFRLC